MSITDRTGPQTWLTSDPHWFHRNIITYCARPFSTVDQMAEDLVRRWNEVVAPGDTVWCMGDWTIGRLDDALALVARLNGDIRLVSGNHDQCWGGNRKGVEAGRARFEAAGITVMPDQVEIALLDEVTGQTVLFDGAHMPFTGDSHDQDRYADARPVDRGRPLIHGHVHDAWRVRQAPRRPDGRDGSLMLNVGIDAWDYAPVGSQTVVDVALGRRPDLMGDPPRAFPGH